MQALATFDTDLVRTLADLVNRTDLTEIVVERGDFRIRVRRAQPRITLHMAAAAPALPHPLSLGGQGIRIGTEPKVVASPMVGTVRLRSPGTGKPYAWDGARVEEGETLLLIEAMKTFCDVIAPRGGSSASRTSRFPDRPRLRQRKVPGCSGWSW